MKEKLSGRDSMRYAFMLAAASLLSVLVLFAGSGRALAVTVPDEGMDIKQATGSWLLDHYSGASDSGSNYLFFQGAKGKKISSVKSSNAKVVSAKAVKGGKFLQIQLKKRGKAKVTYKYDKKTYKITLTVEEYVCPAKSFKLGSKEFVKQFKKHTGVAAGKHFSGKVSIKPVAGYKLKSITLRSFNGDSVMEKKIKNNSTIKKGQGDQLEAAFVNKKTGKMQWIYLYRS